jgi:hypothetical protein
MCSRRQSGLLDPPKAAEEYTKILGHSRFDVTMNIYSHVVRALKREPADQMDAILNPVPQIVAQVEPAKKAN